MIIQRQQKVGSQWAGTDLVFMASTKCVGVKDAHFLEYLVN